MINHGTADFRRLYLPQPIGTDFSGYLEGRGVAGAGPRAESTPGDPVCPDDDAPCSRMAGHVRPERQHKRQRRNFRTVCVHDDGTFKVG